SATVSVNGRALRIAPDGSFVFGVGRDAQDAVEVLVEALGDRQRHRVAVTPREYRIERVDGLPQQTVTADPAIAERIAREQAKVAEARQRDDPRTDWRDGFTQPVQGRISGVYGS